MENDEKRLTIENLPFIQEFTKAFEEKVGAFMQLKVGRLQDIENKFVHGYCVIDDYSGATEFHVLDKNENIVDYVILSTQIDFETKERLFLIIAKRWDKNDKCENYGEKSLEEFDKLIDNYILYRLNVYKYFS